jgi:hypothetical protein
VDGYSRNTMEVGIWTSERNFSWKSKILQELRASVELSAVVCVCFDATLPVVYVYIHDCTLEIVFPIILHHFNFNQIIK